VLLLNGLRKRGFSCYACGDHFVTFPAVRGFVNSLRRSNPKARVGLLQLMPIRLADDNPAMESSAMGRLSVGLGTGGVDARNISQIGVRVWFGRTLEIHRDAGIHCFTMKAVRKNVLWR